LNAVLRARRAVLFGLDGEISGRDPRREIRAGVAVCEAFILARRNIVVYSDL